MTLINTNDTCKLKTLFLFVRSHKLDLSSLVSVKVVVADICVYDSGSQVRSFM